MTGPIAGPFGAGRGPRNSRQLIVAIAAAVIVLSSDEDSRLVAQTADSPSVEKRLGAIEEAMRGLEKQLFDLSSLLRAALPPAPLSEVSGVNIDIANAAVDGPPDAPVVMVEWSDFECPFCGQYERTIYRDIRRLFIDSGRIRYAFRNLPLESIHHRAAKAAEAAECARRQGKFWEMHDRVFGNQRALEATDFETYAEAIALDVTEFRRCVSSGNAVRKIQEDAAEANRLGLSGTPVFLLGDIGTGGEVRITRKIVGVQKLQVFQAALEDILGKREAASK